VSEREIGELAHLLQEERALQRHDALHAAAHGRLEGRREVLLQTALEGIVARLGRKAAA
jgi:hypothetical protein